MPALGTRVAVWDLPLRLFHALLAAAVALAITTGLLGGSWMTLHGRAGLAVVGLIAFRLVWGVVGSTHARFANFVPTPTRLCLQWQGRWQGLGHNPLGALSVMALLGLLAVQAGTGLFGNDEISFTGPLAGLVDDAVSIRLTGLHQTLAWVLYALVALHVAAIVWHAAHGDDLVRPMLRGWKAVDRPAQAPSGGGLMALVLALGAGVTVVVGIEQLGRVEEAATAPAPASTTPAPRW
jgi:cytochrome b